MYLSVDESDILVVTTSSNNNTAVQSCNQSTNAQKVEVVTTQNPLTGEPMKQLVQMVTDPITGKQMQVPIPANISADNLEDGLTFL